MTPSPEHSPPQPTRARARRGWRYPLVATAVSTALVLSPLATQAFADDQVPGADPSSSTAAADPSTPTDPTADPSNESDTTTPSNDPSNSSDASDDPTRTSEDSPTGAQDPATPDPTQSDDNPAPHGRPSHAAAADAAGPNGCGYGTGGQFASTICWLDMTSYNDTQARTAAGQDMTVVLPGNYTLSYNIKTETVAGRNTAAVDAVTTPIEKQVDGNSRFAFGSEAYRDIPGKPSLYSRANGAVGLDVTLSSISLKDPSNNPVTSYAFVATDTEDNVAVAAESLRWTSDKTLNLLETLYPTSTKGCRPAGITGLGTTTVTCVGAGGASSFTEKSTSILVSADAPSTFALRWQTSARSGIAFGVQTSSIEVVKKVDGRADKTDSFDVSLTSPGGSSLGTATTNAANSATTGAVVVIPPNNNAPFTLTDAATPGSTTDMSKYTHTWACTRNGAPDASLPSGEHTSISVPAGVGDQVVCTVTNQAKTFDGGDAPATYGTALAGNGPRHSISDYDATNHTSSLMLGSHVDTELDGAPSAAANSDDVAGMDDEDGLTSLSIAPGATNASATVPVVNSTGAAATLYGWIDANSDGRFQASESATAAVPAGATSATLNWNGLTPPAVNAQVMVRLRLTTGALTDAGGTALVDERSLGSAPDGEVEDHQVTVKDLPVPATCSPAIAKATQRYWYFGRGAGLDFGINGSAPTPLSSGVTTGEGSTVVTDSSGELQFWSNASTIYDANNNPMPNGTGLAGNNSAVQTVAAFPALGQPGKYFVAATSADVGTAPNGSLSYSVVDMSLNGGLGDVTTKNVPLGDPNTASEALTAVPNADGTGFWVVTFTNNSPNVIAYPFDASGPSGPAVVSVMSNSHLQFQGTISFNSTGTEAVDMSGGTGATNVRLLHFDASTGHFFQALLWGLPSGGGNGRGYYADFSPSGDYVYISKFIGQGRLLRYKVAGMTTNAAVVASALDLGPIAPTPVGQGGAVRPGPDGKMYVATNNLDLGVVTNPDAAAPTFTQVGQPLAPGTSNFYGLPQFVTGCPPAFLYDYGDAPATFGTVKSAAGPRHILSGYNSTSHTASLMLGVHVDDETDGVPGAAADGDDLAGMDDEDALTALTVAPGATTATVTVPLVNSTGKAATLYGWIDTNGNGTFQASEAATVAVAAGATAATLNWSGLPPAVAGSQPVARLRLTTTTLSDTAGTGNLDERSQGLAPDGEVEDSLATVAGDFGDAPASFGTTTAAGGPSHVLSGYDATTHTTPLMLGAFVDSESDGAPGAAANGDDTAGVDDEDALTTLSIAPGATTATTTVPVVNSTGAAATLYGWIDTNANGTFQASESATVNVPTGATSATLSWTGLPAAVDGSQPVVRLRLTSATLTDNAGTVALDERSQGAAPDGEVEDSLVTVAAVLPNDCSNPYVETFGAGAGRASLPAGQTTYTYAATGAVQDGSYALVPGIDTSYGGWWHTGPDHTIGDTNGRAMLVNAAFAAGKFFSKSFTGLQVGSKYDFSAWITNANNAGSAILPNVTFNVIDPVSGATLATVNTGNLPNQSSLIWTRYGLSFTATQSTVRLELVNNAPGGGGNDLAIDDVAVAPTCEYGDAPESYGTMRSSNGPVHASGTALRLGATVDYEGDGQPGVAANGDDTSGTDDEDGVGPISVTTGSAPSVDVNVTNLTAGPATLAGWVDLDKSGTFDANERATATVAPGTNAGTVTLTWTGNVTTTQATYARFRLFPGMVLNPLPTGAATAGEVEDYPVATLVPSLKVTKTSDASVSSKPGDVVHYTVKLTNTGAGAFTPANPARMFDDLTGVLDDATYNSDAAADVGATPAYAAPRISWSGALAAGQTVTVTYSVTLKGGGDGHVRNVAFAPPGTNPNPPTPDCTTPGAVPCAPVETLLPKLTITKTANRTALPAVGQTIVYTVTVKNAGPGDFTAAHLATFSDDLSAVLDDTQPLTLADVTVTSGTPSFSSPTLSWSGTLPAGQSATISYTLTYTGAGDHVLVNNACVPAPEALDPADNCRTVSVPGSGLRHHKSVDPASGTAVQVGQVLTYTLTFENVGPVAATVNSSDDLSNVLDDAQLVGAPIAGAGLTATLNGTQLDVTGTVPAGATRTVTYQVQVRPWAAQGDHVLANALACEPGEPAGCAPETTTNPVAHLAITKSSNRTVNSMPGDTITYTITGLNDGTGDFTAADQASVVDDLTGVLDDATYGNDAAADRPAAPTYAAPRITWAGALAHGDTVTITYTVVLKGGGDGVVRNVAWQPVDPGTPGPTPDCATSPRPCDTESFDLPKLTIKKTSNRAQLPAAGQKITYTVTVTNPGPGDYTVAHPATFSDDLTDVLDDATFDAGSITVTTGAANLNGSSLDWSGVLTAGQSATVTYTLTYLGASPPGNLVVDNHACIPVTEAKDPADACRTVHTPGSGLRHFKSVNPANGTPVSEGQVLTYTLTFENVGPAAATVNTVDDLSDVADDAVLDTATITADAGLVATPNAAGDRIDITGTVPTGGTLTVTYQVKVKAYADQGDHVITNALACEPGDPQPCDPTSTSNPVRHLSLTKSSDATVDSRPGDTVSYTVRLVNDGAGDYTALDPASLVDDLTGVLDDATFNGVAHSSAGPDPTYLAPRITWVGPLASGDEVRVTYEVVLKGGGDGTVRNVAWQPVDPGTPGPTPDCATSPRPCDTETFDLPKLVITKTANRTQLTATGQTVTYTVVVTNPGPGDYTAAHVAGFSDDLSDVVDDAVIDPASVTATSGTATYAGALLVWTGALPAHTTATITYTATYLATGNHVLANTACASADEAQTPASQCDSPPPIGGAELTHAKSVAPASGTPVQVGQTLTYTLTFTNAGSVPADVDTSDDLSGVLDDATLVAGSITAGAGLSAVVTGTDLDVTGTVPAGATRTVTYQVTVKPYAAQGDHVLANALACEPGDPAPCAAETTSNPVAHLVVGKSSNRTADSKPGDTITYTVTALNDGPGDFPVGAPATVVDDLTGVLDDATYGNDAAADRAGAPTYAAPRITWAGALAHGDTVTITYTVVLKGGGDGVVKNVAWQPVNPNNPGPPPDCAVSPQPCDTESFDLPKLTLAKSADRADLPATGQTITYTVMVTNQGPGSYTAAHPATFSDDLSEVLDDATAVGSPSATVGAASITGTTLSWTGVLAAHQSATITYTFTYRATGNHVLDNTACVPAAEALVPADACDSVSVPGSGLRHHKSVSPAAGTPVEVGQTLTYTLTFDNTLGAAAATVNTSDDLSAVLDDATLDPASITAGAGLVATVNGTKLDVTGSVPAGATRTVTYQVTVKPFAQQGDHVITNALACEPGEPTPCAPETTTNPVRHLVLTKAKTAPANPDTGDQVSYTVTVHNDGAGDWTAADPAKAVDDLTDVLDDATWDATAAATSGTLTFAAPTLSWSGALAHGDTVTITYTVTVTNQGNHSLSNTANVPGCQLPECTPPPVVTPLPHVVPAKTSAPASGAPVQPGDRITYTLTWTNDGTAPGVVDSTDDLSGVLDDADLVAGPTSSDPAVVAVRTGNTLRVTGPIATGATVTVTYTVKVKPSGQHGDNRLANVLAQDTPQVTCPPFPCTPVTPPGTQHAVGDLDDWKTVDPAAGTPVKAGTKLTYTLHFASVGTGPVTVAREDDLSGVLDDAALVGTPTSSTPALTVTGPTAGRIAVAGTLPAGTTATVTYTVQIKHDGQRGDDQLGNYLVDPGQAAPKSCAVAPRADCTMNTVVPLEFDLKLVKKVVTGTSVEPGDTVRYKLLVSNRGPDTAPGPIVVRDPLPAGLELVSARGKGWDCTAKKATDLVVCSRDDDLPVHKSAPALMIVAKIAPGASGRIINKAKVKAAGDVAPANNTGTAPVTVANVPDHLPDTGFRFAAPVLRGFGW